VQPVVRGGASVVIVELSARFSGPSPPWQDSNGKRGGRGPDSAKPNLAMPSTTTTATESACSAGGWYGCHYGRRLHRQVLLLYQPPPLAADAVVAVPEA